MKVVLCDFCGKKIKINEAGFNYRNKKYRINISVITSDPSRGVRYKRIDACVKCINKFSERLKNEYRKNNKG